MILTELLSFFNLFLNLFICVLNLVKSLVHHGTKLKLTLLVEIGTDLSAISIIA